MKYRIRIIEELLTVGFTDLSIEAETPLEASNIILKAWEKAVDAERNSDSFEDPEAILPDGQRFTLDPTQHSMDTRHYCVLLDGDGREIMPLGAVPPELTSSTGGRESRDGITKLMGNIFKGEN